LLGPGDLPPPREVEAIVGDAKRAFIDETLTLSGVSMSAPSESGSLGFAPGVADSVSAAWTVFGGLVAPGCDGSRENAPENGAGEGVRFPSGPAGDAPRRLVGAAGTDGEGERRAAADSYRDVLLATVAGGGSM
jgi:hypothetical protein